MFDDKLITNEKIVKGKRIGKGQFGEVFKGKLTNKTRIYHFVNVLNMAWGDLLTFLKYTLLHNIQGYTMDQLGNKKLP